MKYHQSAMAVWGFPTAMVLATKLHLNKKDGDTTAVTPLSAIQSEFSMMERMFEKDVIPACEELRIGFVSFSPLASGFLSGKYTKEQIYTGDDVRRVITRLAPENMERNQPLLDLLQSLAQEKNATLAQISLAWI